MWSMQPASWFVSQEQRSKGMMDRSVMCDETEVSAQ